MTLTFSPNFLALIRLRILFSSFVFLLLNKAESKTNSKIRQLERDKDLLALAALPKEDEGANA